MEWQEAVKKSSRGVAERFDVLQVNPVFPNSEGEEKKCFTVRVHRWEDGFIRAYNMYRPAKIFTDNLGACSEGFDDWQPAPI
jgi:hypothetical protein